MGPGWPGYPTHEGKRADVAAAEGETCRSCMVEAVEAAAGRHSFTTQALHPGGNELIIMGDKTGVTKRKMGKREAGRKRREAKRSVCTSHRRRREEVL